MGQYDFDLLVIGGGPAGEKGAAQAAYFGKKTALIEKEPLLGGACINTGTLASKTLRESALFLSGAEARQLYGIETHLRGEVTLAQLMHRTDVIRDLERERARKNLERHKIERIVGKARLSDPHTVEVTTPDGQKRQLSAEFILVATGSTPARPAEIPFNGDNVFDSDTILQMKRIPRSLLVFGGGVIGCEYASLFCALGLTVTLINRGKRLLEFLDSEVVDTLTSAFREAGIRLIMEQTLAAVEVRDGTVDVKLSNGEYVQAEALLYAAGRSGATEGLGLQQLGIAVSNRGLLEGITPPYRTSVASIYAAGDVIGPPALASTSMEQARVAVSDAFDFRYREKHLPALLPFGIYTIPEVSCAGESEESCRKKQVNFVIGRSRYGDVARGQIIGDTGGLMKLIFSSPAGKLLGVHVVGELASEVVHVGAAAIRFGAGVEFLIESVFNYPTLGELYKYAAFDALDQLNRIRGSAAAG
jgi:NAD(P) transhydrogenase